MLTWKTQWHTLVKLAFFLKCACSFMIIAYRFIAKTLNIAECSFNTAVKTFVNTAAVMSVVGGHCKTQQACALL